MSLPGVLVADINNKEVPLCEIVRVRRSGGQVVQWCDVYIGRAMTMGGWNLKGSEFANPYTVKEYGLEEACRKYYAYVKNGPLYNQLEKLRGKVLGCWCDVDIHRDINDRLVNPRCHGEVLMRLLYERGLAIVKPSTGIDDLISHQTTV